MNKSGRLTAVVISVSLFIAEAVPALAAGSGNTAPAAPTGLLTNELMYPVNAETPAFSWIVNDSDHNEIQSAYEIVVTDEVTGDVAWDSGKVESSEQSYISCGAELKEGYPYSWKVRTWDRDGGESPYSEAAHFATGISDNNFNASWISDGTGGASAVQGTYNHFWYVRGSGDLDSSKTVAKALAYVAGEQDYDLYINNTEIGRGQSFDYASETRYQGWDVTDAVKTDTQRLTAGAVVRTYGAGQGRAAVDAGFILRINVFYTDGTSSVIATGSDWTVSKSTPFTETTAYNANRVRGGEGDFIEFYDARKAQEGFTSPDFDASSWTAATVLGTNTTDSITSLTPELSKPTSELVKPMSITVLDDGTTVADFGKVIPARPEITLKNGVAGKQYKIQGGYTLTRSGAINSSSKATQETNMTWVYTERDGEQTYSAWDHLGFRYLSVPACGEKFTADTLCARVVHTDVPEGRESTLRTSDEMLNDVYELMKRSALYSIQNSFVDTPTREKGQFLQDSINISEASTATVFEREATRKAIMQFIASSERYWTNEDGTPSGRLNSVYPNGDGKRDIPDFTISFPYWVWNYYMTTGDKATLSAAYPYIKATADYISENISTDTGLVTKLEGGDGSADSYIYGIVDWPESGRYGYDWSGTKNGARATVNMLAKRAFDAAAKAASELGKSADESDLKTRSESIKTAINSKLINSDGLYCDGLDANGKQVKNTSQHANSYALAFGIAEPDSEAARYISGLGMKQGPMTADILVKGLFAADQTTAAQKLFTEPNDFGWARELNKGYSFTFEEWISDRTQNSQSHGWGAAAAADMLKSFAGVSNLEPGAARVKIAPAYADLSSMRSRVWTERGAVEVEYARSESSFDINISVPANMTAEIDLPVIGNGRFVEKNNNADVGTVDAKSQTVNVGSGTYAFSYSGDITVLPEQVVYDKNTEQKTYSFTDLSSSTFIAGYGEYAYNSALTLKFGSSSSISQSGNGFDIYNDGSYIRFTAEHDGIITISGRRRAASGSDTASTLYMSTEGASGGVAIASTVEKNDPSAIVIGEAEVTKGETYYFYNSGGRPVSAAAMEYTYESDYVPGTGISGSLDKDAKLYTYDIGNTPVSDAGDTYTDTSDYIDLTIGMGVGDDMYNETVLGKGISFTGTGVGDSGSVNDTKRYIMIKPKTDGIFSVSISFAALTGNAKNRIYYKETDDLSACAKSGATVMGGDITTTNTVTRTLDVTAGKTYVIYTYQTSSTINGMSFKYENEPAATPTPTASPEPTAAPTQTPTLPPVSDETCIKITAEYDENGRFKSAETKEISVSEIVPVENTATHKVFYWNDLTNMHPVTVPSPIPVSFDEPDSAIRLNYTSYPLVVGNSSKTDFSRWQDQGSEVTVRAELDAGESVDDLTWSVEDEDIAYIASSRSYATASIRVKGKRTGTTKLIASLPDGERAVCYLSVIDNITRQTVQRVELNTDKLTLAEGGSAELSAILYPKEEFDNGTLNKALIWSSSDTDIAEVSDGIITAKSEGTAVISVTSEDVGRSAECIVKVKEGISTTGISADSSYDSEMTVGDTLQLTADAEGDSRIIWRSENSYVADVNENGLVTAYSNSNIARLTNNESYNASGSTAVELAEKRTVFENGRAAYDKGTINIIATTEDGGFVARFPIRVSDAPVDVQYVSIGADKLSMAAGSEKYITAVEAPASIIDKNITWESSNTDVVAVEKTNDTIYGAAQAKLIAGSAGTAVITASAGGKTDSCIVTVTDGVVKVSSVTVEPEKVIDIDEVYKITASVTENAENPKLIWVGTDKETASLNNEGYVKGYKSGTSRIYAIAEDSVDGDTASELMAYSDTRVLSAEDIAALEALLKNAVYAECTLNVKNSAPELRNLTAPAEAVTDSSVMLMWNRAALLDCGELAGYNIYSDGSYIANTEKLAYTVKGLEPGTAYSFRVEAVDGSGNAIVNEEINVTTRSRSNVINVLAPPYNAKGNGMVTDTYAIQRAINDCPENGTVWLPEGYVFYSGALFIKSGITFRVDGILLGSTDSKDYPLMVTRWEGWRKLYQPASEWANTSQTLAENRYAHASLINAGVYDEGENSYTGPYNTENIVICGRGQINANGFRLGYTEGPNQKTGDGGLPSPVSPAIDQSLRGRNMTFHNAKNVYVTGVTSAFSPSWNIHPIMCDSMTFDDVNIITKGSGITGAADNCTILNGDGLDPENCTRVNISDCFFYTGDDAVALKSGRNREGNELDKPNAYIRVTDCVNTGSKGGFGTGSENASGAHDILFQNITESGITLHGIWLKTNKERGGLTENIEFKDMDISGAQYTANINLAYSANASSAAVNAAEELPEYRYLTFENIKSGSNSYGFLFQGYSDDYIHDVTIRGCSFTKKLTSTIKYGRNFKIIDTEDCSWNTSYTNNVVREITGKATEWDLTAIVSEKTGMDSYDNYTTEYQGLTIRGAGQNDYISRETGVHFNGASSSNRYIAITPAGSGTLTITAKRAFSNSGALYYSTNSDLSGGSAVSGLNSNSWANGTINITAGTTYYLYCSGSGMEIKALKLITK